MKKIGRGVVKFFFGMIITVMVMSLSMSKGQGGAGLNGVLCFAIWLALMFVLIKISAVGSLVASIVLFMIFWYMSDGPSDAFAYTFWILIGCVVYYFYSKRRQRINGIVRDNHRKGKNCCPYCGSTRVHFVQGHTEYSTEQEWNYDYMDSRYHRDTKINTHHHEGHWKCSACGRSFQNA